MCGQCGAITSVATLHQRGLTCSHSDVQRGDTAKAKWQYEKILGKALLGRGPAEHWAHSEYAWIAFNDGDLQVGRRAVLNAWDSSFFKQ